jgi:hypothetical protein
VEVPVEIGVSFQVIVEIYSSSNCSCLIDLELIL